MVRCDLCGWESEEDSLVDHLRKEHFIGYRRYYERVISGGTYDTCWKCGYPRWLYSPHMSEFLPCEACGQNCSKRVYEERRSNVLGMIKEYQSSLGKNKFHQYLLAVSGIDLILGGILQTGLELLSRKKRDLKLRLDRNSIPFLDFMQGYPKEISERNLDNIVLGVRSDIEVSQVDRDFKVTINGKEFMLILPEIVEYDIKHHSRYSILNPGSKRGSKRLRLKGGSGECIKFWGTSKKSTILKLLINGDSVEFNSLPESLQLDLRTVILCVKPIRDLILEIYNEILYYCNYIYDRVFFLSHFQIPNTKSFKFYFSWDGSDFNKEDPEEDYIRLAIL